MTASSSPLPGPLRLTPSLPFVGRASELEVLGRLWDDVVRDGRRVAIVQGEAGSGKTRLVRQVAERAAGAGARVLYGACDPSVSVPYQAFVEALEQLAAQEPSIVAAAASGARGAELAALLPDVASRPQAIPTGMPDHGGGRYRLHAAVTEVLAAHAHERPTVLVLDDLHWADAPTLALLCHVARSTAGVRLLVLATAREVDAQTAPDLADALGQLHRLDGVSRVRLGGLLPAEIDELLRRLAPEPGRTVPAALAGALADLTGGNAFLVAEVGRHLIDAGLIDRESAVDALDAVGVPQGVRDVIAQRLVRMEPGTRDLLELTAVGGRGVELAVLAAAASHDEASLLRALDEATSTRMLEEVPGARITYRFGHELLRRAVFDRLPSARRAALHLRLARALEAVHGVDAERTVSDLAFHFSQAAELGGRDRAVHYALRAAQLATRSFAFGEAARRLRAALELEIGDPAVRGRVLCDLGAALHRSARPQDALEAYASAATLARETGDAARLADAAIGFENTCWRPGIEDPRSVVLLEEALAAVGEDDGPLRVTLLAGLSRARAYRGEHAAAEEVWRDAVGMARRVADPRSLAVTLFHAAWTRGSQDPRTVLTSLDEARDLFGALGDDEFRHEVESLRLSLMLEAYDTAGFLRELPRFREDVERSGQPFYLYVMAYTGATVAICDARMDDAQHLTARAFELSRQFDEDAGAVHGIQAFTLYRELGRLGPVAPLIRLLADRGEDDGGTWGPALTLLLAELGMLEEARRELQRLCADDLGGVRRGGLWLGGLSYLADACALVDDPRLAAVLYAELHRLEGKNVVIGQAVACYGAADRYLGMLARTMGDLDTAERHFEAALEHNGRMPSPTWIAHTQYEYALALRRRGVGADAVRADELLADAHATAARTGLVALAARTQRAGLRVVPVPALPGGMSAREIQVLRLVACGLSNREIGASLHISQHTAANHIRSILSKTGCANRTEAASYAHEHFLVDE